MRIAIFSDNFYPELSGVSDSIIRSATELARRDHHITFYVPRYAAADYRRVGLPVEELRIPGIRIHRFTGFPFPTGTGQGRLVIPFGLRSIAVRRFHPDIIHVHLPFGVGFEGLIASRTLCVPLVGTNHTPMGEFVRYSPIRGEQALRALVRYTVWFYNRCDFVSAPCNAVLKEMVSHGFHAPHHALSNPLDVATFRPVTGSQRATLKQKYGLEGFILLYAGRLAPEKNIDLILKAAPALVHNIPNLTIALIGTGSHMEKLRLLTAQLGIAARVRFFGFVKEQSALAQLYSASDVFVMPSTAETQSLVMIQAMLCGIPVIGVNAWGLPEYIPQGVGFVIEPGNVGALQEKILFLSRDEKLRISLGKSARTFAAHFSTTAIADEWEKIYREIIARHHKKGMRTG